MPPCMLAPICEAVLAEVRVDAFCDCIADAAVGGASLGYSAFSGPCVACFPSSSMVSGLLPSSASSLPPPAASAAFSSSLLFARGVSLSVSFSLARLGEFSFGLSAPFADF